MMLEEKSASSPKAEFEIQNDFGWKREEVNSKSLKIPCVKTEQTCLYLLSPL